MMTPSDRPNRHDLVIAVFGGLTMAFACMALVVGTVMFVPAAGPLLWLGIPASLFAGMMVIHRTVPDYSYPIAVLFVSLVGAILALIAFQVSWTVLGNSL